MLVMSLLRCVFIPLILLCNVGQDTQHVPIVFKNDFFPAIFMALVGLTNGYLGSLAMIVAPT